MFNYPYGVAVNGTGAVFVGDGLNYRVRVVVGKIVYTFAGGGSSGVDGIGTSASFSGQPGHLSFASNGNLFVAEGNSQIRLINPKSVVSTVVGRKNVDSYADGYGTTSLFSGPRGVTVSFSGSIYIADTNNNRIRQSTCVSCPSSFFCSTGIPRPCFAGSFCPQGTNYPLLCGPGTFSAANASTCSLCPSNTFHNLTGQTSCQPCNFGTAFSTPGSIFCWPLGYYYNPNLSSLPAPCPANTFTNKTAATLLGDCVPCPSGTVSTAGSSSCVLSSAGCPAGSYTASLAPLTCTPCPAGSYALLPGSLTCTPCETGTYSTSGSAFPCSMCPQGFFCPSGVMTPCPQGTYGDRTGQVYQSQACTSCLPGTYQPSLSATSLAACTACASGFFSSAPASSSCTPCSPGKASPLAGSKSPNTCTACSPGKYTGLPGQSTCTEICPSGWIGNATGGTTLELACLPCPAGSYSSFEGSLRCTQCPPGQYAELTGSTYCEDCPIGYFSNTPSATSSQSCTPCSAGSYNPAPGQTSSGCIPCPPGSASFTEGASLSSQCQPCSAGFFASLAGSVNCTLAPAGSYTGPSSSSPSLCPLGRYSSFTGAVSQAQCTDCPAGKTTASTGATQSSQCLAIPYTCPPGQQPTSTSAASQTDCTPLTCPSPLRPSAYAGFNSDSQALAQSLSCLGCAYGTSGTVPFCTPCSGNAFCPGLTSRPLFNFSDPTGRSSSSSSSTMGGSGSPAPSSPFSACPSLALLAQASPSSPSSGALAASSQIFGTPLPTTAAQCLLAWLVLFALLLGGALCLAWLRPTVESTGICALPLRALTACDMFSMSHLVEERTGPMKESTPLGGLFSLMGLTTVLTYAAYLVATWVQDNTLVQQSLATMGPLVWGRVASLPWAAPPISYPTLGSSLALRLTIDGNPGACAAPLLPVATTNLAKGAFVLASTADCGGTGVAQHTLTCPGCQLSSDTTVSLVFHYSCQSMLLEALGVNPSYPGPLALTTLTAPTALTAAAPKAGAFLTSLTWKLTPVLSVLWDNVTGATSAIGWELADSKLTLAPPLTLPFLNGTHSLVPTASSVTVTFALALSTTYASTLLMQRVPITLLLANIVGLSGLLTFFALSFSTFEACTLFRRTTKRPLASAGGKGDTQASLEPQGDSGGLTPRAKKAHRTSMATTAPATPEATEPELIVTTHNPLQKAHDESDILGIISTTEGGIESQHILQRGSIWKRYRDEKDTWYVSKDTGDTAWSAPEGSIIEED